MVKTYEGNFIDKKNARIQQLKDQMHEVREAKNSKTEKVEALERLLKTKDEPYSAIGARRENETTDLQ